MAIHCFCRLRKRRRRSWKSSQERACTPTMVSESWRASTSCKVSATSFWAGSARKALTASTRDFYVRQLRDWKGSADTEAMVPSGMSIYAGLCGWTLARAHARSGDRVAIASYLGGKSTFDEAIADFASAYADLNERDYAVLQAAQDLGPHRGEIWCLAACSVTSRGYFRMLTARATTSPKMTSEATASTAIASLAQRASGITSVGLNATAFVKARYR